MSEAPDPLWRQIAREGAWVAAAKVAARDQACPSAQAQVVALVAIADQLWLLNTSAGAASVPTDSGPVRPKSGEAIG